jgi:peptidoglycan/xylan/chitin deacetylase (PgdA/CDA1 family)
MAIGWIVAIIGVIAWSLRYNWWRLPVSDDRPRVLMYHMVKAHIPGDRKRNKWRVKPEDFEKQMAWFAANGWHSYTISEMVEAENLPPKSFCITFDDGYADNFTHAFPVLQRYGFKATIYLVPGYTHNRWENFEEDTYDALLTAQQIEAMQSSGLIEFGSHTLNHKNLLTLSQEEAQREITESKQKVESITHEVCKAFAYPYGKYDQKSVKWVEEAGYENATVVKRGTFEVQKPYEIRRIGILGTESFFDFYLKITRIRNKV